ncbi:MAG: cytochrome c3 family protein [Gammaproteobacteria bacterium]|nr:cytochrome c3 family protein [Gammaproteobacteria bacterium]
MKNLLKIAAAVALVVLGFSPPAMAVQNVAATKHNLSSTNPDTVNNISTPTTAFVCGFCHSPHTEAGGPAPLWNRGASAATYTMYTSPTMDMTVAGAPASISQACLSCHDGTVAFDQLINGAGSGGYNAAGASQGWQFQINGANVGNTMAAAPGGAVTNLGTVLTGDHPISVTYDPAQDPQFVALATVQASTLQLYGAGTDQVECATCHNPHEATNPTFLRASIDTLCTTCHIK